MKITTIGIILFAYICSISICTVVGFGQNCTEDVNCTQNSEVCDSTNSTCSCNGASNYSYTGSQCDFDINECSPKPCLNGGVCTDRVNDFTCNCPKGFSTKTCAKADLGALCTQADTTCLDTNAACGGSSQCVCINNYYDDSGTGNVGGTCKQKVAVGDSCPDPTSVVPKTATCSDSVATCESEGGNYRCKCPATHYDDNGVNQSGGNCVEKVAVGDSCPDPTSVAPKTATCSDSVATCELEGGNYRCKCPATHYDDNGVNQSGGNCVEKVAVGDSCPDPTSVAPKTATCSDSVATCELEGGNYRCKCPATHYDDNGVNQSGGNCVEKVAVGDSCPDPTSVAPKTATCSDSVATCELEGGNYRCKCPATHYDDNGVNQSGGNCVEKVAVGDSCPDPTSVAPKTATCSDSVATCELEGGNYRCKCPATHYDDNGVNQSGGNCVEKVAVGDSCPDPTSVAPKTATCSDSVATCELEGGNYRCKCPATHYDDNGVNQSGGNCVEKLQLGKECPLNSNIGEGATCKDSNARCRSSGNKNKCQCIADTHYDSDGSNIGGTCKQKVGLGSFCPQPDACSNTNAECSNGNTCVCKSSYYDSNGMSTTGGQCVPKVELGYRCPMPDACISSRAVCAGSTGGSVCKCKNTYYDDNTDSSNGGQCQDRKSLGTFCSYSQPVNIKQCTDANAQCSIVGSYYYCSCNARYHREGSVCAANKALGMDCVGNISNECSDPNAKCLGNKCTCDVGYYKYDPAGDTTDVCKSVVELQVTGISFSDIQTKQITVSWTPPSGKTSYINLYTIEWRPLDNSVSGNSMDISTYSPQSITGLTPGKAYEVKVISKNTATQPGSPRTTSANKTQATKPSKPGNITSIDLDARDKSISIKWAAATGDATLYNLTLYDVDTVITSVQKQSRSATTFSHSSLKNGYNYKVHIEARSEAFQGTSYLWSALRIAAIKTVVQVPNPPTNVQCDTVKSESIILTWLRPMLPNGDLVRYNIHVYRFNGSDNFQFTTSTQGVIVNHEVMGLSPGTSYRFRIYTQNELYNSTDYGSSDTCTTRAKMADIPEKLKATDVTSRNFSVTWNEPIRIYSDEILGYVTQIKKGSECVKEIVYTCSDCIETFQVDSLDSMCDSRVQNVERKSKVELRGQQTYDVLRLLPDTSYNVTVTVVNNEGQGHPSTIAQTTNEEAPQVPHNVVVSDIGTTSFNITWEINGPRPGQTSFNITLTADFPGVKKEFTVVGFNIRIYEAKGLEEYWNYNVSVTASTSIGAKTSITTGNYRTKPAAPGIVSKFKITNAPGGNYTQMQVTWKAPQVLQRNSFIKEYTFEYRSTERTMSTRKFDHEAMEAYEYTIVVNVMPEDNYTFEVYAVNAEDQVGEKIIENRQAPAGIPINIEETSDTKIIPEVKNKQQTSITVVFVKEFFEQSLYGAIHDTGMIVCAKECDFSSIKSRSDFNNLDNWKKASQNGYTLYRATPQSWIEELPTKTTTGRRKREVTELEFTVGSDACTNVGEDEYCNGPLKPETKYTLVAVACSNGGCLLSSPYGPFSTLAEPPDSNLGMIIGIVVGVTLVLGIGAVVGFILIRRRRGPGGMKPALDDDDEEFTGIDPAIAKIPRKRPIQLSEIEEYVNKMHRDSNLLFSAEYEELKTLSPKHSCEAADREENRMRNRYINIIPFDHTRVKLSTNGEDDASDYINANYLPGYNSPREYIGCQGPIPGTIDDFWRMVWEQNVSVVVMLTLCKEGQKIKCEQYWPDEVAEPKQYGDVIVEITSYSNIRTYDYRMFKITNGNKTRVVKHFHFLSWLDFQANVHHDIILDFIQHIRQHVQPPDTSGPMIIHCSAGVGRTGTYISLDHLIQFINEHDFDVSVDIFDMVLKLRENRMHMVQTEQQYVFIHDCVKEIMERKRRQMENIYENQGFSAEENIYQNESLYANVAQGKEQNTEL